MANYVMLKWRGEGGGGWGSVKMVNATCISGLADSNVSSPLTRKIQYCGEPPSSRGSVFDLRPPGSEF